MGVLRIKISTLGIDVFDFCSEYQKCFSSQKPIAGERTNLVLDKTKMKKLFTKLRIDVPSSFGQLQSSELANPYDIFHARFENGQVLFY